MDSLLQEAAAIKVRSRMGKSSMDLIIVENMHGCPLIRVEIVRASG